MKEIKLSQRGKNSKFKLTAIVDNEEYDYLSKFNWSLSTSNKHTYAKAIINNKVIKRMHRLIMKAGKGQLVDHIDGNGLNNQKSNLRLCTASQNGKNRKVKYNSSSKYLGVSRQIKNHVTRTGEKMTYINWIANIAITGDGKNKYIGCFKTQENAAIAYNIYAEKYHGEFANLNKYVQ